MKWNQLNVLVTGGASFIGSHLVDALVDRRAFVRVVDDLSSGRYENIKENVESKRVEFFEDDLLKFEACEWAMDGIDVVFHLAAIHGGRGYVDLHQAETSRNFVLSGNVIEAAKEAGVEQIVFASSGCVYPNYLQGDVNQELYLTEDMVGPPYDSDNIYGWEKLMTEFVLKAYHDKYGIGTSSCRFFTVYGPRGLENHAVIAMIAKAFIKQNPFEVWGDGTQIRNWTYVEDIISGMILAAEKIHDGRAVNLGTMERTRVIDAVEMVMDYTKFHAPIRLLPDMPTGPLNRVADNTLARDLLGWEPKVMFKDGLRRTIDWYFSAHDQESVRRLLQGGALTERGK